MNSCPVCHEPYLGKKTHGISHDSKGATYSSHYYQHEDKECVLQKVYYPNYFGKGPKTVVHSWSTAREKKPKETISFYADYKGRVRLNKNVSHDLFNKLMREGAVVLPKSNDRVWSFDKEKARPILEKEYKVI